VFVHEDHETDLERSFRVNLRGFDGVSSTGGLEFEFVVAIASDVDVNGDIEDQEIEFWMRDLTGLYAPISRASTIRSMVVKGGSAVDPDKLDFRTLTVAIFISLMPKFTIY
jgi:hypothetical protein